MYVYIKSELNLWTVGFYDPNGKWIPESDHATPELAAEKVHYLNGGVTEEESRRVYDRIYEKFKDLFLKSNNMSELLDNMVIFKEYLQKVK